MHKKLIGIALLLPFILTGCLTSASKDIEKDPDKIEANIEYLETFSKNWNSYQNIEYGFEFYYPDTLSLKGNAFWSKEKLNGKNISSPEFVVKTYPLIGTTPDNIIINKLRINKDRYEEIKDSIQIESEIGPNKIIEVQNIDMPGCNYYTQKDDLLIAFYTKYNCDKSNDENRGIELLNVVITTLKMKPTSLINQ